MCAAKREFEGAVLTKKKQQTKKPSMYNVLLHNDDYTTMDFVVMVLESIFNKNGAEATRIMLNVHQQGVGVAGVYPKDIAETKVVLVHDLARKNEFPLKCSIEMA
ncbi:MAG: ATP-dependent Clp protease adapter ClpS [Desulfobulbaceae bacterium]|nr:ATP-dependent Clp protease adapter ClpS [Desulfobulbaceae bacterium]HIJ78999.1 ATP-dependent Clp protease adapter ClpS [Deltaproteobacteria bacterium]